MHVYIIYLYLYAYIYLNIKRYYLGKENIWQKDTTKGNPRRQVYSEKREVEIQKSPEAETAWKLWQIFLFTRFKSIRTGECLLIISFQCSNNFTIWKSSFFQDKIHLHTFDIYILMCLGKCIYPWYHHHNQPTCPSSLKFSLCSCVWMCIC